jgi:hypothetical protein
VPQGTDVLLRETFPKQLLQSTCEGLLRQFLLLLVTEKIVGLLTMSWRRKMGMYSCLCLAKHLGTPVETIKGQYPVTFCQITLLVWIKVGKHRLKLMFCCLEAYKSMARTHPLRKLLECKFITLYSDSGKALWQGRKLAADNYAKLLPRICTPIE